MIEERINNFIRKYDLTESFGKELKMHAEEKNNPNEYLDYAFDEIIDEFELA